MRGEERISSVLVSAGAQATALVGLGVEPVVVAEKLALNERVDEGGAGDTDKRRPSRRSTSDRLRSVSLPRWIWPRL
jgi:hypothetical protein